MVKAALKKNKKTKARKALAVNGNSRRVQSISRQLDAGALAYRKLLADPCHAPLTSIPFAGTTSGLLYRTRTIVTPATTNVSSMVTFAPSYTFITNPTAGSVRNGPIITWGTDGVNDSVTNQTAMVPYVVDASVATVAMASQYRCVAACIRATYTGSEMSKSGLVYGGLSGENPWGGKGLGVYGASSVGTLGIRDYMSNISQSFVRLNGTHEVRWVPDQESLEFIGTTNGDNFTEARSGGTLSLAVVGHPTGSPITYEIIAVWEVIPETIRTNPSGGTLIPSPQAPKSSNTLNHVLQTIGDVAGFVVHGLGGPGAMMSAAADLASSYLPVRRSGGQRAIGH